MPPHPPLRPRQGRRAGPDVWDDETAGHAESWRRRHPPQRTPPAAWHEPSLSSRMGDPSPLAGRDAPRQRGGGDGDDKTTRRDARARFLALRPHKHAPLSELTAHSVAARHAAPPARTPRSCATLQTPRRPAASCSDARPPHGGQPREAAARRPPFFVPSPPIRRQSKARALADATRRRMSTSARRCSQTSRGTPARLHHRRRPLEKGTKRAQPPPPMHAQASRGTPSVPTLPRSNESKRTCKSRLLRPALRRPHTHTEILTGSARGRGARPPASPPLLCHGAHHAPHASKRTPPAPAVDPARGALTH